MTRTSTTRDPAPPTRSIDISWIARSSFAWADGERSDTSSRNSVPPSRMLELAAPASHTSRSALLDAEQLGLEQRLDERRAVDRDERSIAAHAQVVNLSRNQLLSRPTLSFNQRGEVRRGDPLDTIAHRADAGTGTNERRRAIRLGPQPAEKAAAYGAIDDQHERRQVPRAPKHLPIPVVQYHPVGKRDVNGAEREGAHCDG